MEDNLNQSIRGALHELLGVLIKEEKGASKMKRKGAESKKQRERVGGGRTPEVGGKASKYSYSI